jgi:preprotein translocase subunit SecB
MNTTVLRYAVVKLFVRNDLPKDDHDLKIPIQQNIQYQLEGSSPKDTYRGLLSLHALEKKDDSKPRFELEVQIEILFRVDSDQNIEIKELHGNTLVEFLPYLSSYVGLLSALTGFPPMVVKKPDLNSPNHNE